MKYVNSAANSIVPKLSIVIPIFNNAFYFPECIDSILSQNADEYEIIIVDDGSFDDSGEMSDMFAAASNLTVVHSTNRGVSNARNFGLMMARGEYIWFVDSDDVLDDDSIMILYQYIDRERADFISFGIERRYFQGNKIVSTNIIKYEEQPLQNKKSCFAFLQTNDLLDLVADKVCSREVIAKNGIFFDQTDIPTEDHIFWLNVYPFLHSVKIIDRVLYYYYLRDGNSSSLKLRYRKYVSYAKALKKVMQLGEQYGAMNSLESYCFTMLCYYLLWEFETLLHQSCKLTLTQRYYYLKETIQQNNFDKRLKKQACSYFLNQKKSEVSNTGMIAVWLLSRSCFFLTAVLSLLIRKK